MDRFRTRDSSTSSTIVLHVRYDAATCRSFQDKTLEVGACNIGFVLVLSRNFYNAKLLLPLLLDFRSTIYYRHHHFGSKVCYWILLPIYLFYFLLSISSFFFILNSLQGSQRTRPSSSSLFCCCIWHPHLLPQVHPVNLQPMFVHGFIGGVCDRANSFFAAWIAMASILSIIRLVAETVAALD